MVYLMTKVVLDLERIRRVAEFLKHEPACIPGDWIFEGLPQAGDPRTVDYFFTAVKHQFGFWLDNGTSYTEPMYGTVEGRRLKGSDFVWQAIGRTAARNPEIFELKKQADMSDREITAVFSGDDGRCPLPMSDAHCELWREFAKDMVELDLSPARIVESARRSDNPIRSITNTLSKIGGYKEDPLAKKATLLAVILANRPERFLGTRQHGFAPIVDYHIMRSLIRIGLVKITDPDLETQIQKRKIISQEDESAVRRSVYDGMLLLEKESGKGIDALDWFFFQNRKRCPEMSEPECPKCEIQSVCAKRKELFQPVTRTTFY